MEAPMTRPEIAAAQPPERTAEEMRREIGE